MLEFLLGAGAATMVSKKFRNKSKDEIKEILSEGFSTTAKIVSAGVELATDKINNSVVSGTGTNKEETNETGSNTKEPVENKIDSMFK